VETVKRYIHDLYFLDYKFREMRFASRLLTNQLFERFGIQNIQKPTTIYLKHVKWVTGRSQLEKHFDRYGKIKDVSLFFVRF